MTFEKKILSLLLLLAVYNSPVLAQQTYSLKINQAKLSIDSTELYGYTTTFTQPYKAVKKEWWRYIKARAMIFNKITHLELKVPPKGEATDPVFLVSRVIPSDNDETTRLEVGLRDDNLSSTDELLKDLKQLILDFKVSFYTTPLQKEIKTNERQSALLSAKLNKYQSMDKIPKGMTEGEIDSLIQRYTYDLSGVESKLDSLRVVLLEIK